MKKELNYKFCNINNYKDKIFKEIELLLKDINYNKLIFIKLVLGEWISNLVKHGKCKFIYYYLQIENNILTIKIYDKSKNNFKLPKNIKKPTINEIINKEGGLGLYLINILTYSFKYLSKDNINISIFKFKLN